MEGYYLSKFKKLSDNSKDLNAFVAITKLLEINKRADQDNFFPALTIDKEAFVISEIQNIQDFLNETFIDLFPEHRDKLETVFGKLDEALQNSNYLLVKEFLSDIIHFVSISSYAEVLKLYRMK